MWLIGASSGIGEATAHLLMQRGARVALTSRNRDALTALADGNAHVAVADVTDRISLQAAFDEVCAVFGAIDVAIINAAGACLGTRCRIRREPGAGESGRRDECQRPACALLRATRQRTDCAHRQRGRLLAACRVG